MSKLFQKIKGRVSNLYSRHIGRKFATAGKDCYFRQFNLLRSPQKISLGNGVRIGKMAVLAAWNDNNENIVIEIGNGVDIGDFVNISAINKISIGGGSIIGRFVTITDNSHGTTSLNSLSVAPYERPVISKGPVIIGRNVWIGDKVTILPGVTIGNGAIIGANAVVTHDIPDFCIAYGSPAVYKHASE